MLVLGIESSCDETSIAIVEDGKIVHSNVIYTQIDNYEPKGVKTIFRRRLPNYSF